MRILKIAMMGVVLMTAGSTGVGGGQMLRPSLPRADQMSLMSRTDTAQRIEMERMRISERQKRLVEDTDKLLVLSTALKQQVDESNKDILSLDMIRKAEEIEKLAHSVKERIKS